MPPAKWRRSYCSNLASPGSRTSCAWRASPARMARRNLAWTFGYNSVALALAASGALRPVFAAALMLASSLAVVANTLRLPAKLGSGRGRNAL